MLKSNALMAIAGVFMVAGLILMVKPPSQSPEGSEIPVERSALLAATPADLDFGSRPLGTKVHLSFVLKNVSDERVAVEHVSSSCGCTSVDFARTTLLPDEELPVKVRVDVPRKKAGALNKAVYVMHRPEGQKASPLSLKVGLSGIVVDSESGD